MYALKTSANTPGYLKQVITNQRYECLPAHDQQFYAREAHVKENKPEMVTVVGKDILGTTELQTVDRNTCDERQC
jgi:hypothetical protein